MRTGGVSHHLALDLLMVIDLFVWHQCLRGNSPPSLLMGLDRNTRTNSLQSYCSLSAWLSSRANVMHCCTVLRRSAVCTQHMQRLTRRWQYKHKSHLTHLVHILSYYICFDHYNTFFFLQKNYLLLMHLLVVLNKLVVISCFEVTNTLSYYL